MTFDHDEQIGSGPPLVSVETRGRHPIDVDLRPGRGKKRIFSLFYCLHCAYTDMSPEGGLDRLTY